MWNWYIFLQLYHLPTSEQQHWRWEMPPIFPQYLQKLWMWCSGSKAPKTWKILGASQESAFSQLSQITSELRSSHFPWKTSLANCNEPVYYYSRLGTEKDASGKLAFIVLKVGRVHIALLREKWLSDFKDQKYLQRLSWRTKVTSFAFGVWAKATEERGAAAQICPGTQRGALLMGWEVKVAPVEITDGDDRVRGWGTHFSSKWVFVNGN